eukprot:8700529-Lingulodinium_polyedra.AAC.1
MWPPCFCSRRRLGGNAGGQQGGVRAQVWEDAALVGVLLLGSWRPTVWSSLHQPPLARQPLTERFWAG